MTRDTDGQPGGQMTTAKTRQSEPRSVTFGEDELLPRWRTVLGSEPFGGLRGLQREVVSLVVPTDVAPRRSLRSLATRLNAGQPDLGVLVHELAGLRQVLNAALAQRLDAPSAAGAQDRVNGAIDALVEACTASATERLAAMALVDPLTGLRNRRGLEQDLNQRLALAERGDRPLTVVVCDVDGLKAINDGQGHAAGDHVLRALGEALEAARRAGDQAYRIGGDEFLLMLPDTDHDEAKRLVERVSAGAPSFGWGSATFPFDGHRGAALIQLADQRLLGNRRHASAGTEPVRHTAAAASTGPGFLRFGTAATMTIVTLLTGIGVGFAAERMADRRSVPISDSPATTSPTTTTDEPREPTVVVPPVESADPLPPAGVQAANARTQPSLPEPSPPSTVTAAIQDAIVLDIPTAQLPDDPAAISEEIKEAVDSGGRLLRPGSAQAFVHRLHPGRR